MTSHLPAALLFDMDDTILTDGVNMDRCWQATFAELAEHLAHLNVTEVLAAIRAQARWYWSDRDRHRIGRLDLLATRCEIYSVALERLGVPDSAALARLLAETYTRQAEQAITFREGAQEALAHIRAAGVRMALVTNGAAAPQRRKIERFELAQYFDAILIEGELGFGKPEPQIYQHALKLLEVRPEHSWMVGDQLEWEVAVPQSLGIRGIWVDAFGTGLPETSTVKPYRVIRSLTELLIPD